MLYEMKIIFGIIASDDEIYSEFKNVWIKAIVAFKKTNLHNLIDFYFLYSDKDKISKTISFVDTKQQLYVDFYDKDINESVTKTILNRTVAFFNHIKDSYKLNCQENYDRYKDDGLFFVRTNLSTMFNFNMLIDWFKDKPKTAFFGGSLNGFYNGFYSTFSGTNLVFTLDIMLHLYYNKHRIEIDKYFEDEAISQRVLYDFDLNVINMKRIDFIEMEKVVIEELNHVWPATPNSVIYHKTKIGDNHVFCFRFKTFNRQNDINAMKLIVDKMFDDNANFNLTTFIDDYCNAYNPPLSKREEAADYGTLYSEKPFKIIIIKRLN